MTMLHITEERLLELLDAKVDELFDAIEEIKADPIQQNWVYGDESHDMADLIERQDRLLEDMDDLIAEQARLLKLADDLAECTTAEDEYALAAVVAYRIAREKLK